MLLINLDPLNLNSEPAPFIKDPPEKNYFLPLVMLSQVLIGEVRISVPRSTNGNSYNYIFYHTFILTLQIIMHAHNAWQQLEWTRA